MRTRRSPRNQDRLFRLLFKPAASPASTAEPITRETFASRTLGWGKADKTRVMRAIEKDELRVKVRAALSGGGNA
jgi:hypothetical protein